MERLTFRTRKRTYVNPPYGVCSANRPISERIFCVNCHGPQDREKCMPLLVIDRLAAYEDTMSLERAQELAQAEKDGRLVVLPCKVGDLVYALWDVPTEYKYVIYCAEIKEICMSVRNCRLTITYRLEPIEYRGRRKEYRSEDFGKTVFLTCEEAEAALKKRKAGNEH